MYAQYTYLPAANTVAMMISPLLHLTSQQSSTDGTVALTMFFLGMIEIVSSTVNFTTKWLGPTTEYNKFL